MWLSRGGKKGVSWGSLEAIEHTTNQERVIVITFIELAVIFFHSQFHFEFSRFNSEQDIELP